VIRNLEAGEAGKVAEVWEAAELPHRPGGRDEPGTLARFIEDNPDLCRGAWLDGELVGVAIGSEDGRKGWINRLAVLPRARRRGVALALLESLEEAFSQRGIRVWSSLVFSSNEESLALFEKAGYSAMPEVVYLRKADSDDS